MERKEQEERKEETGKEKLENLLKVKIPITDITNIVIEYIQTDAQRKFLTSVNKLIEMAKNGIKEDGVALVVWPPLWDRGLWSRIKPMLKQLFPQYEVYTFRAERGFTKKEESGGCSSCGYGATVYQECSRHEPCLSKVFTSIVITKETHPIRTKL